MSAHDHTEQSEATGHQEHAEHNHAKDASERRVLIAMLITFGFMIAEVIGGVISGSLTLLADAAHMLTDAVALTFAWFAFRIGRRPADARRTFGFHRLQIIVAMVNGIALFAIAAMITVEAVERFFEPVPVTGMTVLVVGLLGLLVNFVSFRILTSGDENNLNMRGAALHVLGDILGSLAALIAAAVILLTSWYPIDPMLSIVVSLIVLKSAWRLVREAGHILMEGTPEWIDITAVQEDLRASVPDIVDVHHVHAWMITPERPMITLHAKVARAVDVNRAIHARLKDKFGLNHATVQLEQA